MREKALYYYNEGYNCSQCILKAVEYEYKIPISKQVFNMCQGVNTGFGVEGMCSVLMAGILAFGLLFDDQTTKRLRIKLLDIFSQKYPDMNCGALMQKRKDGFRCEEIVGDIAEMIERIIDEERQ